MILAFLTFILTLILVIGIHETGHGLAARFFSVRIQDIAIGFGKELFSWQKKSGIKWIWAIWPIGGYVRLLNSRIEPVEAKELSQCFDKKPIWIRCLILIAGGLANLLMAFLALILMYKLGYIEQTAVIERITPQSLASQAGLKAGDQFISIAGRPSPSWQSLGRGLLINLGKKEVPILVVDEAGKQRPLLFNLDRFTYTKKEKSLFAALGIKPADKNSHTKHIKGQPLFVAAQEALSTTFELLSYFLILIKQIVTAKIPFAALLGPLGLLSLSIKSMAENLSVFLYFIANLSMVVGLVNLFPIPGLDGGSLVYLLIEKLRGKPVSIALEVLLHRLAVIFFVILCVQLLMNDLQRYFNH